MQRRSYPRARNTQIKQEPRSVTMRDREAAAIRLINEVRSDPKQELARLNDKTDQLIGQLRDIYDFRSHREQPNDHLNYVVKLDKQRPNDLDKLASYVGQLEVVVGVYQAERLETERLELRKKLETERKAEEDRKRWAEEEAARQALEKQQKQEQLEHLKTVQLPLARQALEFVRRTGTIANFADDKNLRPMLSELRHNELLTEEEAELFQSVERILDDGVHPDTMEDEFENAFPHCRCELERRKRYHQRSSSYTKNDKADRRRSWRRETCALRSS